MARLAGGSVSRALALDDEAIWKVREELVGGLTAERPNFARLAEVWTSFYKDAEKDTAADAEDITATNATVSRRWRPAAMVCSSR